MIKPSAHRGYRCFYLTDIGTKVHCEIAVKVRERAYVQPLSGQAASWRSLKELFPEEQTP